MSNIALVSYINTRPFLDGFEQQGVVNGGKIQLLPPSDCARALQSGEADLALVPVGALPDLGGVRLLSSWCIGASGPVDSVFLLGKVPLEEMDGILLDPHSRSSNGLVQILLRHHWQHEVRFYRANERRFDLITGSMGGVVIGDEAVRVRKEFPYVYDLSEHWQKLTGLSFAFAVWAYRPAVFSPEELDNIRQALRIGVQNRLQSAEQWADFYHLDKDFARMYLEHRIDYRFDSEKHRAVQLYLSALSALPQTEIEDLSHEYKPA